MTTATHSTPSDSTPVASALDTLLAVATRCTVHNTLASEPDVSITLADTPAA